MKTKELIKSLNIGTMRPIEDQIYTLTQSVNFSERGERRFIFTCFRSVDQSNLYPVHNRFNITNRVIRNLWKFERDYGQISGIELIYFIESEISRIVNDPNI